MTASPGPWPVRSPGIQKISRARTHRGHLRRATLVCWFLFTTATAHAATSVLDDFFNKLRSISADFEQTVSNEHGQIIQRSVGRLYILRPGKFRWEYDSPYRQLIVSDGSRYWVYDEDLEQVTVHPLDETLSGTPAQLLSSDEPLEAHFEIHEFPDMGHTRLELVPIAPETNYQNLQLICDGKILSSMEIHDSFGQVTFLALHNLQRNPRLAPNLFSFTPPPGVDVVGRP